MCDYRRVVWLLLRAALEHQEDLIQRIAIGLCNLMVCQVRVAVAFVSSKIREVCINHWESLALARLYQYLLIQ